MRLLNTLIIIIFTFSSGFAQYHIEIKANNLEADTLYLGYFYAQRQYLVDTAVRIEDNRYVFKDKEEILKDGIYFIHEPHTKQLAQFLISDRDKYKMELDFNGEVKTQFAKSKENKIFNDYLKFITGKRKESDNIRLEIENGNLDEQDGNEKLESLDSIVTAYQHEIIDKNPESLVAAIIKAGLETDIPNFDHREDPDRAVFNFYKSHYFDHIDFKDDRLIRTPILVPKVDKYLDKLVPPIADSVIYEVDNLIQKMDKESDIYRFFLVHLINKYANSKLIGMDAVFVHLVDNYVNEENADWLSDEQRLKIKENVNKMRPLLIGKKAPDFEMYDKNGYRISLSSIEADYTLLFFWDPDCGYCKKEIPKLVEFFDKHKDRNISIIGVCNKFQDEVSKCWEYVEAHEELDNWIMLVDPLHESRYKIKYNLIKFPMLYVLDKDKNIVFKELKAEQLDGLLDFLDKENQKD